MIICAGGSRTVRSAFEPSKHPGGDDPGRSGITGQPGMETTGTIFIIAGAGAGGSRTAPTVISTNETSGS